MNKKSFFRHAADMIEPCTLARAGPKKQRKSPAQAPGFF
jgi:hypothetical protein